MKSKIFGGLVVLSIATLSFEACSPASGDNPGHEYMPDMAHSIAYEANKIDDYSLHTWDKESVRSINHLWGTPRKPIAGTIARGSVGLAAHGNSEDMLAILTGRNGGIATPINGNVPYYYQDTEEERVRATKEMVVNPFPITAIGLKKGEQLWKIYCGICHGDKCNGNGYLVAEENKNAKYPAQPANLLLDTFVNGNNGRLYHAIMYGKNVMGGYSDKLSYEERWQVIHYIRKCQADEKKLAYNERSNIFKPLAAVTDSAYQAAIALKKASSAKPSDTPKPEVPHNAVDNHNQHGSH